ncbi:U6 snRNA-associated Sm-like protein LSm11 [Lycorma delicatula]|uniref:U6 snRNA-associated Sm-like protein LSm11 n=1 Tax=Lycorma delicatula TaxID=130591 RepID=UPI003F516FBE
MSSSEEEINFYSPKFDALKALNTKDVKVPCPNAPILDNISKFEMNSEGVVSIKGVKEKKDEKMEVPQPSTSTVKEEPKIERFLPSQGLLTVKRRPVRNILTRMEVMSGPLEQLRICMELRRRVKIITRRAHQIRGFCEGFVEAFDKHWNLAVSDVREVWSRKKSNRCNTSEYGQELSKEQCERMRRLVGIRVPNIVKHKITRKREDCERFVSKLFLRGEHVVCVILL